MRIITRDARDISRLAPLMTPSDAVILFATMAAAVALVAIVRWRRRTFAAEQEHAATEMVCAHLRPAWEALAARGHHATRVGQRHPDLPMEIHVAPPFDPVSICTELRLSDPVFVSERNVIYCQEDWCEIHPTP